MTISRSTGYPAIVNGVCYGMAGGGYSGCAAELDAVVARAAEMLSLAYGRDVEIRFNADRESGGAFLTTPDGGNAQIGITASVVTAAARARWAAAAAQYEAEADSGRAHWQAEPLAERQREGARECAAHDRGLLARHLEDELTVYAHITAAAVASYGADASDPDMTLLGQLAVLPGWSSYGLGCHHGPAPTVASALARCLRFAPSLADLAQVAGWENEGGA